MPHYSVILEGTGISLVGDGPEIVGFVATRTVRASDETEAVEIAKNVLAREWANEPWKSQNMGEQPRLRLEYICQLRLFDVIFRRYINGGHIFYPKGESD